MSKGRFRTFMEDVLRIRIKPNPNTGDDGDGIIDEVTGALEDGSHLLDIAGLNEFRTIADDRENQYKIFDEMAHDSIIASALEMYADDSTQYSEKGEIIWAESEDSDVAAFANQLIEELNLNKVAWSHIYSLVKYGDLYLETFSDLDETEREIDGSTSVMVEKEGSKLDRYIEMVPNPAEIFDLQEKGKVAGFIRTPKRDQGTENYFTSNRFYQTQKTLLLRPDKFIHIPLSTNTDRYPEYFKLVVDGKDDEEGKEYRIVRGKSILHDIFKIYKECRLMEDAILLNRVTRSSIIRIMQVEIGDMPKTEVREKLKRIKQMVEQKNFMDKNDGKFQSMAAPGPIDNVIYVPTRHGNGSITASNVGGDVDVKSIVDLDYFKNKLFGGLKIPKQFLGDDMEGSGLSAGTSLTKLDARYARTVKRIQNAYIEGITNLINMFAHDAGLIDHIGNFTVKMVSPSTIEDQERNETKENNVNMTSSIMELIDTDFFSDETKKEILVYFINGLLNEPDIGKILEQDDTANHSDEPSESDYGGGGFGGMDHDIGGFEPGGIDTGGEELEPTIGEPEVTNDEDFGDFSDEF